ncbi:MAG: gamma-glutamyltranspeptidase / glutathione hydrolase [Frankiaceae bacterium]|nr:gamma-glutamyltranspeptidase / glutathione hydrolase [Frankiaceae bacterium]
MLRSGGSAADAAVATSAVLAVTTQHMCGMGGDLFALVHEPGVIAPAVLNASGRAGSGADPDRLRRDGHRLMPPSGDVRAVTMPGCVDGWLALHGRFGRLPLAAVLAPARGYATDGFPAAPILSWVASMVAHLPGGSDFAAATHPGAVVRRPGVARCLDAVVAAGRDGFYGGEFGAGLLEVGAGEFTTEDLARDNADWVEPLGLDVWGRRLWTVPPNSQGYLTLAGAWIAAGLALPADTEDPLWAHFTVEAARQAAYDRVEVLHEGADGPSLLDEGRLGPRRAEVRADRAADLGDGYGPGGTISLCVVDTDRMGVSLIQSNAGGFGANIAEPSTGVFLQNRGIGFSLEPGHPAEYRPGRRPPHTLAPALVTAPDGRLDAVLGTMGGDSQPQILLQLLARVLGAGESIGAAVAAPRWALSNAGGGGGFSTWAERGRVQVELEPAAPPGWSPGLTERGHRVRVTDGNYGHAHMIAVRADHLEGASDPRALSGAAAAY